MSPDIAASVRARLLNKAKQGGEEFERTLARFAAERLLYRIGASPARDRCLLKGASLLTVWLPDPYRATRDVDILASGAVDDEAVRSFVAEICAVPCPEDGLRFDLSELVVETIRPEEQYSGKRARFRAFLGRARIAVQLDIGVGDAVAIEPEEVTYPTMLSPLPAPRLRAYRRELTVAEKFEGPTRHHVSSPRPSTRRPTSLRAGATTSRPARCWCPRPRGSKKSVNASSSSWPRRGRASLQRGHSRARGRPEGHGGAAPKGCHEARIPTPPCEGR